jgi:hypothetical protein
MNDLATFTAALAAAIAVSGGAQAGNNAEVKKNSSRSESVMEESQQAGGVANLPYARGQSFRTLDAYLAHLERQGAIDLPWWRQVKPGIYERVTSMRGRPPERATRAELMRRFGFTR